MARNVSKIKELVNSLNNTGITDLSEDSRSRWEALNKNSLERLDYFNWSLEDRQRGFKRSALRSIGINNKESIDKYVEFADSEVNNMLATAKTKDRVNTGVLTPASTPSMREGNKDFDLFLDDVDITELNAKGINYTQAAQSIKRNVDDNYASKVISSQEELNKSLLKDFPEYRRNAISNIKKVAEVVSPTYLRYGNTDLLQNEKEQFWLDLSAEYQARVDAGQQDEANRYLTQKIQDKVYENQNLAEQLFNTGMGAVANLEAGLVSLAGVLQVLGYEIFAGGFVRNAYGALTDDDPRSYLARVADDFLENTLVKESGNIQKFGLAHYFDKYLGSEEAKKRAEDMETSGIGRYAIEKGSDNAAGAQILEVLQQYGFTAASMASGAGLAKGTSLVTKLLRKGATGSSKLLTGSTFKARKALELIGKGEGYANRTLVPGITGMAEGAMNASETKEKVTKEGLQKIDAAIRPYVMEDARKVLDSCEQVMVKDKETGSEKVIYKDKKGNIVNPLDVYNTIYKQYSESALAQEMKDQVNWAASEAGGHSFLVESAINGLFNRVFFDSQFGKGVTNLFSESKLVKKLTGRALTTSGNIAEGTAKATYNGLKWWQRGVIAVKEPGGEAMEEGAQTAETSFFAGAAVNSINAFIQNRIGGDGQMKVGQSVFGEDVKAAWVSLGESFENGEIWQAAAMGALGSVFGGAHLAHRGTQIKRDSNGKPILKDGKVQYEKKWGRTTDDQGNKESWFDFSKRITPWRSGLLNSFYDTYAKDKEYKQKEEIINNWLQNPKNLEKFNGLAGTMQWQEMMNKAAKTNSEFEYRSAKKNKLINDVMMLEELKGTELYNSIYDNLSNSATLSENTTDGQEAIQMYRNTIDKTTTLNDTEILDLIKKNVKDFQKTTEEVKEAYKQADKMFGNIDPEAKKAIAFNIIRRKDLQERKKQVEDIITTLKGQIATSDRRSSLDNEGIALLEQYGSVKNIQEAKSKKEIELEKINKDIEHLNSIKEKSDFQKQKIKELKSKKDNVEKEIKQIEKFKSHESTEENPLTESEIEEAAALSESEILNIQDDEQRAAFLLAGIERAYNAYHSENGQSPEIKQHYSDAQQKYIDSLIEKIGIEGLQYFIDYPRINAALTSNNQEFLDILSSRDKLASFIGNTRMNAKMSFIENKYAYIDNITDYNAFLEEMDNLNNNSSPLERLVLMGKLQKNKLYQKYNKDAEKLDGVVNFSAQKVASQTDIQTLQAIRNYLLKNGINENSTDDEILRKLYEQGEGVTTRLVDYIRETNEKYGLSIDLSKINEIVSIFKDNVINYTKNKEIVDKIAQKAPQPTSNTSAAIAPPKTVDRTAEETGLQPEEIRSDLEEGLNEEQPNGEKQGEAAEPIQDTALQKKFDEIVVKKYKDYGFTVVSNYEFIPEIKEQYESFLTSIEGQEFTGESFLEFLDKKMQEASLEGNLGSVLRSLLSDLQGAQGTSLRKEAHAEAKEALSKERAEQDKTAPKQASEQKLEQYPRERSWCTTANATDYPKGNPIRDYLNKFNIAEFLTETLLKRQPGQSTNIFFYNNPTLNEALANYLGKDAYEDHGAPIVVCYVLTQEEALKYDKNLLINDNGNYYMPVAVLPSNTKSSIAKQIRDRNTLNKAGIIPGISSTNKIVAPSMESGNTADSDKGVKSVINQEAQKEAAQEEGYSEKTDIERGKLIREKIKHLIWNVFAKNLKVENVSSSNQIGHKGLVYHMKDGRKGGESTSHFIFVEGFDTVLGTGDLTIPEYLAQGLPLSDFNNYFIGLKEKLNEKIAKFKEERESGKTPQQTELFKYIDSTIKDFFNSDSDSFKFSIKGSSVGTDWSIYLGNEELVTFSITDNDISLDFETLFKNLIAPEGQLRSKINFQVNYELIQTQLDSYGNSKELEKALIAGLLRFNTSSLFRPDMRVQVSRPQGIKEDNPPAPSLIDLGSNIANSNQGNGNIKTSSGETVDPITGSNNNGQIATNDVKPTGKEVAQGIVNKIINETKKYLQGKRGKTETSYSQGSHVGMRQALGLNEFTGTESQSNASTVIGNTMDNLLRDITKMYKLFKTNGTVLTSNPADIDAFIDQFFEDYVDENPIDPDNVKTFLKVKGANGRVYYNYTAATMRQTIKNSIIPVLLYFQRNNLTVFSDNLGITRKVTKADGTTEFQHGYMDLLAYDDAGNFYVFDVKTHRPSLNDPSYDGTDKTNKETYMEHWSAQVGGYAQTLTSEYLGNTGLKVVYGGIISLHTEYPISDTVLNEDEGKDRYDTDRTDRGISVDGDGNRDYFLGGKVSLDNGSSDPNQYEPLPISTKDFINPVENMEKALTEEEKQDLAEHPFESPTQDPSLPVGDNKTNVHMDNSNPDKHVYDLLTQDLKDAVMSALAEEGKLNLEATPEKLEEEVAKLFNDASKDLQDKYLICGAK